MQSIYVVDTEFAFHLTYVSYSLIPLIIVKFRNLLFINRSIDDQTIKDFRGKSSGINKDDDYVQ
jgi:hypothetical protein